MTTLLNGVCLVCEGDFLNIINEGFFIDHSEQLGVDVLAGTFD